MRLIDADRLKAMARLSFEELAKYPAMDNETPHMMAALDMLSDMIDNAPTVCELGVDLEERKESAA